ncbi:GNAT family N-acetyltransferase [Streptomyces sp. NPDC090080]|uniref:GNAT family N-acetyltransferase n=1 Tax=Streptomyces sp. NPDC090080 TaxID=3365939 RepID=UPI003830C610
MNGAAHGLAARISGARGSGHLRFRAAAQATARFPAWRSAVTVHTLEGSAALEWLEYRWPALYEADPLATPFGSPGWLLGWAGQLRGAATALLLLAVGPAGVCAGLALLREDGDAGTELRALSPYCEYVTPVGPGAQDMRVADALASRLAECVQAGALVTLANVPAGSPLATALRAQDDWQHALSRTAAVPLPLDLSALPKSARRQHIRREQALAAAVGTVTFHRTRTTAELLAALPALETLHAAQRGTATRPSAPGAWAKALGPCADGAFIAEARIDGAAMAAQLCLQRGRRCYSVLPAMDPAHSSLSPGHALLRWLTHDLAVDGIACLDLGPTRETAGQLHYKAQYGPVWDVNASFTAGRIVPGPFLTHTSLTKGSAA